MCFTLASFSFWTSSCIFFFSFSNSVMIRTWFILVSSKACKCDSVGFILLKFYSGLPCYTKAKDDARDEKKKGEGRGKDNAPPPCFSSPAFFLCTNFSTRSTLVEECMLFPSLALWLCQGKFILSNQLQILSQAFILISTLTCLAARASICNFFLLFRISCSNNWEKVQRQIEDKLSHTVIKAATK